MGDAGETRPSVFSRGETVSGFPGHGCALKRQSKAQPWPVREETEVVW